MTYQVHFVVDAELDLLEIYQYLVGAGVPRRAEKILDELESVCFSLEQMPERGHFPPELLRLGIRAYRELNHKVYRIVYQIVENDIYVHCILDGRRDMQSLLQERLLRPEESE